MELGFGTPTARDGGTLVFVPFVHVLFAGLLLLPLLLLLLLQLSLLSFTFVTYRCQQQPALIPNSLSPIALAQC